MKTIIVGIDGSHAAITAALWGVDEAISRAVPLRLVSVIKPTHPSPDDYDRDLAHAERSLREAQSAVEAAGKLVKIETDIPRGPAGPVLVEASRGDRRSSGRFRTANSNVACRIGTTVIPMCASTRSPLTRVLPGSWPTTTSAYSWQ